MESVAQTMCAYCTLDKNFVSVVLVVTFVVLTQIVHTIFIES